MKFCLSCGDLSQNSYCDEHLLEVRKAQRPKKASSTARGYGSRWARLSRKARTLSPFCEDCGATTDLQADHTPEAWERYYAGKVIRLQDISVVCGPCNRARGQARPDSAKPGEGGSLAPRPRRGPVGKEPVTYCETSSLGGVSDGGSGA